MMVQLSAELLRLLIPYWGLDLHFRLGGPLLPSRTLVQALKDMSEDMCATLKHNGPQFLILRMKVAMFMLNRYLAGAERADPWLLGTPVSLSRGGLPKLIPTAIRRRIVSGDKLAIRLMESILNSYKAFEGTHSEQDLGSVIGGNPLDENSNEFLEFKLFCKEEFWPKVIRSYAKAKNVPWESISTPNFSTSAKGAVNIPQRAGPNGPHALLAAHLDAWAWSLEQVNWPLEWARHVGDSRTVDLFERVMKHLDWETVAQCMRKKVSDDPGYKIEWNSTGEVINQVCVGKLELLPEPAGKVRTIAIVDYWTQRVCSPIHDWMMSILRLLPTDGTFDQEGALSSFAARVKITGKPVDSIDLKSATDLIPISLYSAVIGAILGEETAELWIALLTDRDFVVPRSPLVRRELRGTSVRYGRGQPMGTLSSWPSMALVHHALELFAAKKAGFDPAYFVDYRILGDDNVTGEPAVALSYRSVASSLCVPLSEAKTLSGLLYIFASQIFKGGVNLSPLSLKEELGVKSYSQRLELALRALRRGWLDDNVTIARFLRLLLSQKDYKSQVREWARGRLGRIAQSALVSAFGAFSRPLLDLLGIRGSGFSTFLNALANRVQSIAGDQDGLSVGDLKDPLELERAFAITAAQAIVTEIKRELESARFAALRYDEWRVSVHTFGLIPVDFLDIFPFRGHPHKEDQGLAVYTLDLASRGTNKYGGPLVYSDPLRAKCIEDAKDFSKPHNKHLTDQQRSVAICPLNVNRCRALWEIIEDSYRHLFGISTIDPTSTDYNLVENDDLHSEYADEDDGCGVTFTPEPGEPGYKPDKPVWVNSSYGPVTVPDLVLQGQHALEVAQTILHSLVHGTRDELGVVWYELDALLQALKGLSRLPKFLGLKSFVSVARKVDILQPFVKRAAILAKVWQALPYQVDFVNQLGQADLPTVEPYSPRALALEEADRPARKNRATPRGNNRNKKQTRFAHRLNNSIARRERRGA